MGHLTFCEIFFSNSPPLVKIDQIFPPKISAHFFCKFSYYLQYARFPILLNILVFVLV